MSTCVLHDYVAYRFRQTFGEPATTLGKDVHWQLRPRPNTAAINVLVNGSASQAIVWVFDPYDHGETVREVIVSTKAAEDLILLIQQRLRAASTFDELKVKP